MPVRKYRWRNSKLASASPGSKLRTCSPIHARELIPLDILPRASNNDSSRAWKLTTVIHHTLNIIINTPTQQSRPLLKSNATLRETQNSPGLVRNNIALCNTRIARSVAYLVDATSSTRKPNPQAGVRREIILWKLIVTGGRRKFRATADLRPHGRCRYGKGFRRLSRFHLTLPPSLTSDLPASLYDFALRSGTSKGSNVLHAA